MRPNILLGTLLATLTIGAGWELAAAGRGPAGSAPVIAVSAARDAGTTAEPKPITALTAAILDRPLFSEDRRPAAAVAAVAAQARVDKPPRLSGILVTATDRRAIFESSGKPVVGVVGTQMGSYRILTITPTQVTLQGPDGPLAMRLNYGGNEVAPKPARPGPLDDASAVPRTPAGLPTVPTFQDMMANLPKSNAPMSIGSP